MCKANQQIGYRRRQLITERETFRRGEKMLKWSHNRDRRLSSSIETVGKKRSNWSNNLSTYWTSDTQVGDDQDGILSCDDLVRERVTQNTKALSKWRKVTNTIKFINVSKNCVAKQQPSTMNQSRKYSKWTIVRIAFSAVNILLRVRKTKNEQLHKKVMFNAILYHECSFLKWKCNTLSYFD